ncbi:MAG: hypothetical protein AAGC77_12045 [Pseudomonadota bacterium]
MNNIPDIPEGYKLVEADPVEFMLAGDLCTSKDGVRYMFYQSRMPCEPMLLFYPVGGAAEFMQLPLSQARAVMTPDNNRAEGQWSLEPIEQSAGCGGG